MITINPRNTAIVVTDPQNDFLSPGGAGYDKTKPVIEQNNTIINLENLMKAAKTNGYQLFISPHYLMPHDNTWIGMGVEEEMLINNKFYQRQNDFEPLPFGADFEATLKPYIMDGKTIICSGHKIAGPQTNDLVFQLQKHGITKVIIAGVLSNICVESHMRDLTERGFQVAIAHDATAAGGVEAYNAALVNYKDFASASWSTTDTITNMRNGAI